MTLGSQSLVSNTFPTERNTGFLGEMTDSRTGQEKHKMRPEHLIIPESKEVLKKKRWRVMKTQEPTW